MNKKTKKVKKAEKVKKLNCWEAMKCGREPGGEKASEFGVCPASIEARADKINKGKNAGRACWAVAGTFCRGIVQGTFAIKFGDCKKCRFFKRVIKEEGTYYKEVDDILKKLEERDIKKYLLESKSVK